MQATSRLSLAQECAPVHYERHRPERTTLYRLVQQHAATLFEQAETAAGAGLPQFVKDEFDAFLECDILAHGFLRLHCGDCGHDKLVAFRCKRRGLGSPFASQPFANHITTDRASTRCMPPDVAGAASNSSRSCASPRAVSSRRRQPWAGPPGSCGNSKSSASQ